MVKKHSNSDDRPRIYIDADPETDSCRWRIEFQGRERGAKTAGQALDAALAAIRNKDAVIFFKTFGGISE